MSEPGEGYIVVLVSTSSKEEAENLANVLIKERMAACCNILPGVTSIYEWKGKMQKADECLLLIKTRQGIFGELVARVTEDHSYDCPEIIALPILEGFSPYLDWISANTRFGTGRIEI